MIDPSQVKQIQLYTYKNIQLLYAQFYIRHIKFLTCKTRCYTEPSIIFKHINYNLSIFPNKSSKIFSGASINRFVTMKCSVSL